MRNPAMRTLAMRVAAAGLSGVAPAKGPALAVVLAVVLAGCAAKPDWSKPGVPTKKVTEDWNYCRADANETAGIRSYDSDSGGALQMTTIEAKKRKEAYDRSLESCMTNLGYRRTR